MFACTCADWLCRWFVFFLVTAVVSPAFAQGPGQGPGQGGGQMGQRMQKHDKNGDGIITSQEFSGPAALFSRLDTNNDQRLDKNEQQKAQQAMMDRMQNRRNRKGSFGGADSRKPSRESMEKRVSSRGVKVGDQVPDAQVFNLQGEPVQLASLWKDRPLLLVTGSITCPIAVGSCPTISALQLQLSKDVSPVILYVKEAHPASKGSDFSNNQKTGRDSYPQPKRQSERQILAKRFHDDFGDPVPVYVVPMDGKLIQQLGTGPNSALLIGSDGKLLMKQGWFDAETAKDEINKALSPSKQTQSSDNTLVIGFSQTMQWFGGLEQVVDGDHWELLAHGGAGVDRWQDPNYVGWKQSIRSPTTKRSGQPDRVILTISGPYGEDVQSWEAAIKKTIEVIKQKLPSAKQIVLQSVVGGPDGQSCGGSVRAARQYPTIVQAIQSVVASDKTDQLSEGIHPMVSDCSDYRDAKGHLNPGSAIRIGQLIGRHYQQ